MHPHRQWILTTAPPVRLYLAAGTDPGIELDLVFPTPNPWEFFHQVARFDHGAPLFANCDLLEPLIDWIYENAATPEQLALAARITEWYGKSESSS